MMASHIAFAQIKMGIHDGLPATHIYKALKDQYGYLWIGTTNGICRYDGYEFRNYDLSNGLADNDIWNFTIDNTGRIWLCTISTSIGYIYKNQYYKPYIDINNANVYPRFINKHHDGIVFLNNYPDRGTYLYKNQNDSIKPISRVTGIGHLMLNNRQQVLDIGPGNMIKILRYNDDSVYYYKTTYFRSHYKIATVSHNGQPYSHYFISNTIAPGKLLVSDIDNSEQHIRYSKLHEHEGIKNMYADNNDLYVVYNSGIYKLNNDLRTVRYFPVQELFGEDIQGNNINYILEDSFWGNCAATTTKGLVFSFGNSTRYKITSNWPDLTDYKYLGAATLNTGFWWDNKYKTLLKANEDGTFRLVQHPEIQSPAASIIAYNDERCILLADKMYWIDNKTMKLSPLFPDVKAVKGESFQYRGLNGQTARTNNVYIAFAHGVRDVLFSKDTITVTPIDGDRYSNTYWDSTRNMLWAYHGHKILLTDKTGKQLEISGDILNNIGINAIEKIVVNSAGNIIIKDFTGAFYIDRNKHIIQPILTNYNLKDAKVALHNDRLIVAGKFGVLFYDTRMLSKAPVIYHNIKCSRFNNIYDMQVFSNSILLSTDKGVYNLPIETDKTIKENEAPLAYKTVVLYNGDIKNINSGDTLSAIQTERLLQFNIIRPAGTGKVRYNYKLGGTDKWEELSGNEFSIPILEAGQYHDLTIIAKDDVWISERIHLKVYIIPYWWQTTIGKRTIAFVLFITILLTLYTTVLITRKVVASKNAKRNQLLELEVKALHSQINPHFIFNTLNSALFLIKRKRSEDAYDHVSRFSNLLRSYISSSRKRYINLSDEIINLTNYIELQKARFNDLFTYDVETVNIEYPDTVKIPSLLLQPLVENAINHGLLPKEEKGYLYIRFEQDDVTEELTCIVEDNGIGRHQSKLNKEHSTIKRESFGSKLVEELIDIFNKYEDMDIRIAYIDKLPPETGTIVKLIIVNHK